MSTRKKARSSNGRSRHPVAAATMLLALIATGATGAEQTPPGESPANARELAAAAYDAGEWSTCTDLYVAAAGRPGYRRAEALYNAACCAALAGQPERALDLLLAAGHAGWRDVEHVLADPDLDSLHDHPRWSGSVAAVESAERDFVARVHPELYRMFQEDQADRRSQPIDWSVVTPRDEERRRRAAQILAAGEAVEPEDFFHAAILFQHGTETADYARAEELARKSVEIDPSFERGRWLIAAAHDRWLHSQDRPQVYGTQFKKGEDGRWSLDPIDETAVTDAEREALGVPSLAEARRRAEAMNQTEH